AVARPLEQQAQDGVWLAFLGEGKPRQRLGSLRRQFSLAAANRDRPLVGLLKVLQARPNVLNIHPNLVVRPRLQDRELAIALLDDDADMKWRTGPRPVEQDG